MWCGGMEIIVISTLIAAFAIIDMIDVEIHSLIEYLILLVIAAAVDHCDDNYVTLILARCCYCACRCNCCC